MVESVGLQSIPKYVPKGLKVVQAYDSNTKRTIPVRTAIRPLRQVGCPANRLASRTLVIKAWTSTYDLSDPIFFFQSEPLNLLDAGSKVFLSADMWLPSATYFPFPFPRSHVNHCLLATPAYAGTRSALIQMTVCRLRRRAM